MSNFNLTKLKNQRVLVRGTDFTGAVGETVLNSAQWDDIKRAVATKAASDTFDEGVEAFYAPLIKAAEALESLSKVAPSGDFYVLEEGTEAVAGKAAVQVQLTPDSSILRVLEEGDHDQLIWVDGGLEVLGDEDESDIDAAVALVAEALGGEVIADENTSAKSEG